MATSTDPTVDTDHLISLAQPKLSPEALANIRKWLTDESLAEFRTEIAARIQANAWQELEDSFYTVLPFGTGGRRGPRGIGPNRINKRTIAESARGLASWVLTKGGRDLGIVIAYDTRHGSTDYSRVCAEVIAAAGIKVFLFDGVRATPELSFAVRYLKAAAGIVVSASHNPPSDNGFKAYGGDGGQLVPPDDAAVMAEVEKVSDGPIEQADFETAQLSGLIRLIGREVDDAYQGALSGVPLAGCRDVSIVFSPLHGVGATSVLPALRRAGFADIQIVEKQSTQDGDFPNVADHIPNPEVPAALEQCRLLAEKIGADIALASDPDADRLGCLVKRVGGGRTEYVPLTGNQMGALLAQHILTERRRLGRLPVNSLIVKTAVTTEIIDRIAERFGIGYIPNLLVGFKYIACVAESLDDPNRLVFATEESHGYLSGPYTRDKDGACAALLLAELAAKLKLTGGTLLTELDDIYMTYGYFSERLENYLRPGKTGQMEIADMISDLRNNPPKTIGGLVVLEIADRLTDELRGPDGRVTGPMPPIADPYTGAPIDRLKLAKDNLLLFRLAGNDLVDNASVAVRPSGTEPKCKFYVAADKAWPEKPEEREYLAAKESVDRVTAEIKDDILKQALTRVS